LIVDWNRFIHYWHALSSYRHNSLINGHMTEIERM